MGKWWLFACCLALVAVASVRWAHSQDAIAPTTTAASDDAAPGVKLSFHSSNEPGQVVDARISRLIAIAVPEGTTASAFLEPGPFHATFEGFINLKIRGDYTFMAQGAGACEVIVNEQTVLKVAGDDLSQQRGERVRMRKGANRIVVRYSAPAKRQAELRLYWAERDQPAEPIPPTVLTHDGSDAGLSEHLSLRAGRELFAELRCAKCHTIDSTMPDAHADAPSLTGIGSRLQPEWMAKWINHPKPLRANASMPRMFHSGNGAIDPRALDVAAYLASLKTTEEQDVNFRSNDATHGARLFTGLGCVACHSFEADSSNSARVSLARVGQKWFQSSLIEYLRDPFAHYAWNPMPDFNLSEDEARQLAAYLWSRAKAAPPPTPIDLSRGNPRRGKELLGSAGCLNCHALDGEKTLRASVQVSAVMDGCLSNDRTTRENAPDFALTDQQRAALAAVVAAHRAALSRDTAVDFADRQMRALNCVACHTLDAQSDTWSSLKSEIEAIDRASGATFDDVVGDQSRPSLTWTGEKLRTDWMAKFIGGQIENRPRPWLEARMPSFGVRSKMLADGMAHQHGILEQEEPDDPIDRNLAQVGRRLVGKEKGFSCVTCHAIGSTPAISPFEAFGPNFSQTTERMRHDFYTRWVRNPQRYEPGTRMPQYADLEGKTSFRDVFQGDAEKQFEAIWHYLRQVENREPPE